VDLSGRRRPARRVGAARVFSRRHLSSRRERLRSDDVRARVCRLRVCAASRPVRTCRQQVEMVTPSSGAGISWALQVP